MQDAQATKKGGATVLLGLPASILMLEDSIAHAVGVGLADRLKAMILADAQRVTVRVLSAAQESISQSALASDELTYNPTDKPAA